MRRRTKIIICIVLVLAILAGAVGGFIYMYQKPQTHYPAWVHEEYLKSENNALCEGSNLRIMSYNVLVDMWGGKERAGITDAKPINVRCEQFSNVLKYYSPDVVALQEFCEAWHLNANKYIGDEYTVIFDSPLEYTSMAYNHKKVTLIESEKILFSVGNSKTMRYIAWALFEKNDTHEKFIVTNTHLDFGDNKQMQDVQSVELINKIKELREKYKVPVFALGDYNALDRENPEEAFCALDIYEKIAKESTLKDSKYIEGIKHFDGEKKWEEPTWDHIFVSDDIEIQSFSIISNSYIESISDHCPIFVDAKIK